MVTVRIGEAQMTMYELDESWINQEIRRLNRIDNRVCVRVTIEEGNVGLTLSTPGCQQRGGGGRSLNDTEREIVDLWRKRHLDSFDINSGELIAFLHQLRNIL